jgi:Holliday junction resolvase RusA-like endonuclease
MKIILPMTPVAKGRPRVCQKNGRTWTYTDKKTVEAENFIKACLIGYPKFAPDVPLGMDVIFVFLRPKSAKKRLYPPGDIDNYCKLLNDGLQGGGGIIPDDKQITDLRAVKEYGNTARI